MLLTLFGALPIYNRVAEASPNGQGSIAMLEDLLPRWKGKAVVLCLLGFAATDFVITITLSAADATAHVLGNPFVPASFNHPIVLTLLLLAALSAVFLKGFKEAIDLAVIIVGIYLVLNVVVVGYALLHVIEHPAVLPAWRDALFTQQSSPLMMFGLALLLFPKLALGLSGFETGVAVMPLVKGDPSDTPRPSGRSHSKYEEASQDGGVLMSVFLIGSAIATTLLIPPAEFQQGGQAWGRALAYLAHLYLGEVFGTIYDLSTISILWFAGASAMAGLLNLVPKYLPRYGMAPEWTKATRPLVLLFGAITFLITILFRANVEAQGGAYATGVLMLMTSAAVAVTLHLRRSRQVVGFGLIALVFVYTTVVNIFERPEGIKIASWFIVTIIVTSMISRVLRSTELRIQGVQPDSKAEDFISDVGSRPVRLIANRPDLGNPEEYDEQAARSAGVASPPARRARSVSRSSSRRRIRLPRDLEGHGGRRGRSPRPAVCESSHSERDRRTAPVHPGSHRSDPARVFRLDRRQSARLPAQVPGVRGRGHRPGHSRGASPVGAQSAPPAPHPRRLALDQSTSDTAASSTPRPLMAVTSRRRRW